MAGKGSEIPAAIPRRSQRDVHLDSAGPVDVRIVSGKDAGKEVPLMERTAADLHEPSD